MPVRMKSGNAVLCRKPAKKESVQGEWLSRLGARTWLRVSEPTCRKELNSMPIKTPKELCVSMLSELRHGAERSQKIYAELGQAAQNPEIKEALAGVYCGP